MYTRAAVPVGRLVRPTTAGGSHDPPRPADRGAAELSRPACRAACGRPVQTAWSAHPTAMKAAGTIIICTICRRASGGHSLQTPSPPPTHTGQSARAARALIWSGGGGGGGWPRAGR